MSHVATIDLHVTDLDALAAACRALGLELRVGQKTYRWWGRSVGDYPLPEGYTAEDLGRCDHAIAIPGDDRAYEIGVVRRRDGNPGFQLMWDFYHGGYGMEAKVGSGCGLLKQQYGVQKSVQTLTRQGYQVSQRALPNGHIQLQATK